MDKDMEQWEKQQGVIFLRKIGIKFGQTVLDFGCRVGHYTIPAAKLLGDEGIVFAMDKEWQALNNLQRKALTYNLTNIRVIKTSGGVKLPLESRTVDIVLLYDVLHYLGKDERKKLYKESFRVLKRSGLLSVYPKHTVEDNPIMEFENLHLSDIREEIQSSGFVFNRKHFGIISHDDERMRIFTERKRRIRIKKAKKRKRKAKAEERPLKGIPDYGFRGQEGQESPRIELESHVTGQVVHVTSYQQIHAYDQRQKSEDRSQKIDD